MANIKQWYTLSKCGMHGSARGDSNSFMWGVQLSNGNQESFGEKGPLVVTLNDGQGLEI